MLFDLLFDLLFDCLTYLNKSTVRVLKWYCGQALQTELSATWLWLNERKRKLNHRINHVSNRKHNTSQMETTEMHLCFLYRSICFTGHTTWTDFVTSQGK